MAYVQRTHNTSMSNNNFPEAIIKTSSSLFLFQDQSTLEYYVVSIAGLINAGVPLDEDGCDCTFIGEIEPWIKCGKYSKLKLIYIG